MGLLEDLTAKAGGYVEENSIRNEIQDTDRVRKDDEHVTELATYVVRGSVTVRIPSAGTQQFLRELIAQMEFLDSRSFTAKDAALEILRQKVAAQRAQDEQNAMQSASGQGGNLNQQTVAIAAQARAAGARDEADLARRDMEDKVVFSTVELSLYQNPQVRVTQMDNPKAIYRKYGPGFGYRLFDALRIGWYGIKEFVVFCVQIWPLWIGLILAAFAARAGMRWLRRKKTKS